MENGASLSTTQFFDKDYPAFIELDFRMRERVYESDEDLKNAGFQNDVGDALAIYEKYWQRLKTATGER